ncbi:MAG: DUF4013 domain-containing protein [Rubripirellula sp.]|nr:DUF4013 domain-containing protein [Rubripirellula sp.]
MIDLAQELETNVKKQGFFKRWLKRLRRTLSSIFSFGSLVVLLALLTAIPVVQFIAFGYLLDVSGRLKNGCKLSDSLPKMHQAGIVGLAAIAIIIAALPSQLLTHWESVAHIIDADSRQAALLRGAAIASSIVATFYLLWAWIRGGRLKCYLWPQPKRLFSEGWRWSTWKNAPDQLWNFTTAFELPRYFWIGLRGAVGTLIWLAPTIVIILAFREGESGLAGLVGFLAILCLAYSLFYLPLLQTHFAAENRLSAIFERKKVRQLFSAAPWATFLAMVFALFITPIPLYLLKIEATPREVVWLPCLLFIAFILPARIAIGLAMRRAESKTIRPTFIGKASRFLARIGIGSVVAIYVLFVYVSQYTSWDGLLTWVQQHAILIPVPFLNGT